MGYGAVFVGRPLRCMVLALLCATLAIGVDPKFAPAVAGAAGDANVETCSNEALPSFSVHLPDCRAYEMVSPTYKQGYPINVQAIATDGSRLVGWSWGVFAGAAGGPQPRGGAGTEYEFARGSGGWRATALAPFNPQFLNAVTWDTASADLSRTVWNMPTAPIGQDDFYVRASDGGNTDVGLQRLRRPVPTIPPARERPVARASASFPSRARRATSLTLFQIFVNGGDVWPGDGTAEGFENLYEYVGSGKSAPAMVGVSGGAGSTSLIGRCGVDAGGPASKYNALSENGSTVFFTPAGTDAGGCVKPSPPVDELFARLNESQTVQLSAPSPVACTTLACKSAPAADALFEGASRDGSKGFFASTQQLTDQASEDGTSGDSAVRAIGTGCPEAHGNGCNLYEYDFANPSGENLVLASAGSPTPHVQGVVRISQDGSRVYFVAHGVLTGTPNSQGQAAQSGSNNLYVFERDAAFPKGRTLFIATVAASDEELWGGDQNSDTRPAQASPDGRFLVFQSKADLTSDDTSSGVSQVFEYDAQTRSLVRISIGQHGFNNNGNTSVDSATIPAPTFGRGNAGDMPLPLALSNDGSYIFFQSAAGLTPRALNDVTIDPSGHKATNIFEYHNGEVFLISDGQDVTVAGNRTGSNVTLIGASASGSDVFFTTGDQLVSEDVDTQQDVYDARIGGGLPAPRVPADCQAEACQGALSATPFVPAAGSALQSGGDNAASGPSPTGSKPSVRCKKRLVKKHNKCVKVKRRKKKTRAKKVSRKWRAR